MTTTLARLAVLLVCTLPMSAAGFTYSNFSSTAGLHLVGSATNPSNTIQLTPASVNQAGALWNTTLWSVGSGFSTTFNYSIVGGSPADGIAFVIQNDPNGSSAGGSTAGGGFLIGTDGLNNSVAIAFRTNGSNVVEVDACGAGIDQQINGCVIGSSASQPLPGTHTVTINYVPGSLTVSLDSTQILSVSINLASQINLNGGSLAYVGLTAGTGAANSTQTINSWSFSAASGTLPGTPAPSSLVLLGTGMFGLLAWSFWRSRLRRTRG